MLGPVCENPVDIRLRRRLPLQQGSLHPSALLLSTFFFFFQAEDGIRDYKVTGVQTCALPISSTPSALASFVVLPTPVGRIDVALLPFLRPAREQDHHRVSITPEIDPVARSDRKSVV